MKKILGIVLLIVMAFGMIGCSNPALPDDYDIYSGWDIYDLVMSYYPGYDDYTLEAEGGYDFGDGYVYTRTYYYYIGGEWRAVLVASNDSGKNTPDWETMMFSSW